jgi:hypothetical protein
VASAPSHGVEHFIVTASRLTTTRFRRLNPARLAAAKKEFEKMLAAGLITLIERVWKIYML